MTIEEIRYELINDLLSLARFVVLISNALINFAASSLSISDQQKKKNQLWFKVFPQRFIAVTEERKKNLNATYRYVIFFLQSFNNKINTFNYY